MSVVPNVIKSVMSPFFVVTSISAACLSGEVNASVDEYEPSFDCDYTELSEVERAICDSQLLSYLDSELALLYEDLIESDLDANERQNSVESQRQWLTGRNSCGVEFECLKSRYAERIWWLEDEVGYPISRVEIGVPVRDPFLTFAIGYDGVRAEHRMPVCQNSDIVFNVNHQEAKRCSIGCSSFSCPMLYFSLGESGWFPLFIDSTDRLTLRALDSTPEPLRVRFNMEGAVRSGWNAFRGTYVGQGLPPNTKQVTNYIFRNGDYRSVQTYLAPWRVRGPIDPDGPVDPEPDELYLHYANERAYDVRGEEGRYIRIGGVEWMRCSVGQDWQGGECSNDPNQYSQREAKDLVDEWNEGEASGRVGDWRLPTIEELAAIRGCSSGKAEQIVSLGEDSATFGWCIGDYARPTIDRSLFPGTVSGVYWSSTKYAEHSRYVWYVDFETGYLSNSARPISGSVRLVRDVARLDR